MGLTGDPQRIVHDEPTDPTEVVPVRPTDGTAFTTPGTVFDMDTGGGTQNVAGVVLRSPASGGSVPLAKAEDTAHVSGDEGIQALAVRRDVAGAAALAGLDGDYTPLVSDRRGNQWVRQNNSEQEWYFYFVSMSLGAIAADTTLFSLFNADASKVVRVRHLEVYLNPDVANTGVWQTFIMNRVTAQGTGGTAQTAWLADLNDTALDADITVQTFDGSWTAAPTLSTELKRWSIHTEELTLAATTPPDPMFFSGGVQNNLIPQQLAEKGIVLRQNQGLGITQKAMTVAGTEDGDIFIFIGFTVEG